jgi:hypothetical protein
MAHAVSVSDPEVEREGSGSPCGLAGGPELHPGGSQDQDSGKPALPPEVERALLSCLSLHISTLSELKGHKVEVFGVDIYKHDAVVRRRLVKNNWTPEELRLMVENGMFVEGRAGAQVKPVRGKRKKISRQEPRVQSLLEFQQVVKNSDVELQSFLTLTYGKSFPTDGRVVAAQQDAFHTALRRRYDTEYTWMKEFQKRGAAHFHYLTEIGENDIDRDWLGWTWSRISGGGEHVRWQHTRPETWSPFILKDGAIRYIGKYLRKAQEEEGENQKKVPVDKGWTNWGRWWGMSRGIKAEPLKFLRLDAHQIADAVGFTDSNKFLKDCADGKKRWRTILWDQSDKFL